MPWTFADAVAVEGAGQIAGGMGAAAVSLTEIPDGFGLVSGEPDLYFDLGYLIWLVGDRAGPFQIIRVAETMFANPPPGVTGLAYSLRPFVSGTITPAWWEAGTGLGDGRLAPDGADPAAPGWVILG